jgi:hypothetical protein
MTTITKQSASTPVFSTSLRANGSAQSAAR